jgi:hypothetical protein
MGAVAQARDTGSIENNIKLGCVLVTPNAVVMPQWEGRKQCINFRMSGKYPMVIQQKG